MSLFSGPKSPPPPPTPPQLASMTDADAPEIPLSGMSSLINTGARGLQRRPNTRRTTLLGG